MNLAGKFLLKFKKFSLVNETHVVPWLLSWKAIRYNGNGNATTDHAQIKCISYVLNNGALILSDIRLFVRDAVLSILDSADSVHHDQT